MAWNGPAKPYVATGTGAVGPANGGILKGVLLSGAIGGSALMTMVDGNGGTVFASLRAGVGESRYLQMEAYYPGQGTVSVMAGGGTATLYISGGGPGTAL